MTPGTVYINIVTGYNNNQSKLSGRVNVLVHPTQATGKCDILSRCSEFHGRVSASRLRLDYTLAEKDDSSPLYRALLQHGRTRHSELTWAHILFGGMKCVRSRLGILLRYSTRSLQPYFGPAAVGSDASTATANRLPA